MTDTVIERTCARCSKPFSFILEKMRKDVSPDDPKLICTECFCDLYEPDYAPGRA